MSRERVHIEKHQKKKQNVLFLLVEGETEENYCFQLRRILKANFKIHVKTKSKLNADILKDIKMFSEDYGIEHEELILIYDLENSVEERTKFLDNGRLIHPYTYLSQSCIEVHFLLHFKDFWLDKHRALSPLQALNLLKSKAKHYAKGYHYSWKRADLSKEDILLAANRSMAMFDSYDDEVFSTLGYFIYNHLL